MKILRARLYDSERSRLELEMQRPEKVKLELVIGQNESAHIIFRRRDRSSY